MLPVHRNTDCLTAAQPSGNFCSLPPTRTSAHRSRGRSAEEARLSSRPAVRVSPVGMRRRRQLAAQKERKENQKSDDILGSGRRSALRRRSMPSRHGSLTGNGTQTSRQMQRSPAGIHGVSLTLLALPSLPVPVWPVNLAFLFTPRSPPLPIPAGGRLCVSQPTRRSSPADPFPRSCTSPNLALDLG